MEAPNTPRDSSTPKPGTTKRSGSREAESAESDEGETPGVVQLVPLGVQSQQSSSQNSEDSDMRDRPMYSPSFNPDDLFAFPFPYVPPLSHDALDKRLRASRAQIQGDAYQALFRDLIRPGQADDDVPCGSCPCCQRMLSYVSSLRTVLDHMVNDIVQKSPAGTRVAPCALCLQEHRDHESHQEQMELARPPQGEARRRSRSGDQPVTPRHATHPSPQAPASPAPEGQVQSQSRSQRREDGQPRTRKSSAPRRPPEQHPGVSSSDGHLEGQRALSKESPRTTNDVSSTVEPTVEDLSEGRRHEHHTEHTQDSNLDKRSHTQGKHDHVPSPSTQESPVLPDSSTTKGDQTKIPINDTTKGPAQPMSLGQPSVRADRKEDGRTREDQEDNREEPRRPETEDRTWCEARAQLLEPPALSPRDNHSPVVSHGGQYIFSPRDPDRPRNEAYVSIATDNLTALCCLVLGNSLRLTGTNRSLAVIVTDGVSGVLRHLLQSVFDVVQGVGVMDSQGSTKLALLEQPELGVSFNKLYVWSLDQFTKCVFLESETLVVQNCDELFEREELSAVPDIGWPDCFNSGVFVFAPSQETFWKLIHFAEQQDSFDGGDQGLLNIFFQDWACDISRKLPFLYNLMANVSYTYKPAFKHFGRQVKIVHFFGSYKPWNVQFHPKTGQMAPGSNVHPTYAQFVHFWLEIYTKRVLPIFAQEIQDHMYSQEYACPHEVLQFIPSPVRQQESLPTPPSFRVYSGNKPRDQPSVVDSVLKLSFGNGDARDTEPNEELSPPETPRSEYEEREQQVEEPEDPNVIPGAEFDDFQNMAAWEQGRMDYMGQAKSDTIMKRLDFLIQGKR